MSLLTNARADPKAPASAIRLNHETFLFLLPSDRRSRRTRSVDLRFTHARVMALVHGARAARRVHRHDLRLAACLAGGIRTQFRCPGYFARHLCGRDGDAAIARWTPRTHIGHPHDAWIRHASGRAGLCRRRHVWNPAGLMHRARHLGKRLKHATSPGFRSSFARVWTQRSRAAQHLQFFRRPRKICASGGYLASDYHHAVAPRALGRVDRWRCSRGSDCTFSPIGTEGRVFHRRNVEPKQHRFAIGLLTAVHDRRTRHSRAYGIVDLPAISLENERYLVTDDGHGARARVHWWCRRQVRLWLARRARGRNRNCARNRRRYGSVDSCRDLPATGARYDLVAPAWRDAQRHIVGPLRNGARTDFGRAYRASVCALLYRHHRFGGALSGGLRSSGRPNQRTWCHYCDCDHGAGHLPAGACPSSASTPDVTLFGTRCLCYSAQPRRIFR